MKHLALSLVVISPLLLQASEENIEHEHIFLDKEECMLEEIVAEELIEAAQLKEQQTNREQLAYANDVAAGTSQKQMRPRFQLPIDHAGVFLDAEFLYWKLDEAATTSYAVYTPVGTPLYHENGDSLDGENIFLGDWKQVYPKWNPGFRVKGGYRFKRDLWELTGVYTYYYTKGNDETADKSEVKAPDGGDFMEPLFGVSIGSEGVRIKSKLNFWYHIGDIELSRDFVLTPCISMRFSVGPTLAFIEQKIDFTYFGNYFAPFGERLTETQKFLNSYKWTFKGGGVKMGARSRWDLGQGFNLLFGGALSSVYGHFKNRIKASVMPTAQEIPAHPPESGTLSDVTIRNGKVAFAAQLEGGLGWNYGFKNFNLELFAKYELNTWFNITDQYRANAMPISNDTTLAFYDPPFNLQGITTGVSVNF